MALSTTQYGYIIDPMVPFTDGKGNTIKDGFVRVLVAGSSTPVITYRNFDGAANQDLIELDNSGRTKTSVIGSKGLTYKVCVYDKDHSQESPILTVDKVSVIGANITAGEGATVVTGLDGLTTKPDGFVDASVVGTDGYVALDHTLVTDNLDTDAKATAVENKRYIPLLNDDVNDPDSKMTLGRLWQWVLGKIKSLSTTITAFRTGDVIPVDGPSGTAKMAKDDLLKETTQNALFEVEKLPIMYASYGKNLLDKDTQNKKASCVVYYGNGSVSFSPDTFSAVVVPIPDGVTQISVNSPDAHITAYNHMVDITAINGVTTIPGYLGGSTQQGNVGFNLPVGTKCVVVSCYTESFIYLQVESGNAVTEYESYVRGISWNEVIQSSAIYDDINTKLDAEYGKNLFDKDTPNQKTPCLVFYSNGLVTFTPTTFSAVVVPIPDGVTQISVNSMDAHVTAYNHMVDITAINGVTTIPGYLGGSTQQGNVGFNLPVGTKCVVVSTLTTQLQGLQVESGAAVTGYEPYVRGIHWNEVIGAPQPNSGILHVGTGYTYTTIQSAIDAASDGDTIIVHEGTYTESVNVESSNKFLTIRGTSKKDCILTYSNSNYNVPPIMIGKGCVENLSIIATGTTKDPDAPDYAYCAHIDYDNEENSSLTFNNCYFENEWWACVGIGMRKNFAVSFILCDFVSRGAGRAVFCHGAWYSNNINQLINLIDCSIYTIQEGSHGASIYLEEITGYSGNEMTICMQRCIVKNANGYEPAGKAVYIGKHGTGTGGEGSGGPGYLGSQEWYLHPMSEMNSLPICNYSEQ